MKDKVSLSLPCKADYVTVARMTTSVIANKFNFDIEDIEDLKVAVSEACNNVVIHSNIDDFFNIDFFLNGKTFIIEVEDKGKGFDIQKYEGPDLENPSENGLGIYIIETLMDDVEIKTEKGNGTKIVMSKFLK